MKANEAPEKLYFDVNNKLIGLYDSAILGMFSTKNTETAIEYTRTDAFIEKACAWLRTHSEDDYFELIPDANYCGAGTLNKKRMVDEFRKYMEGENE